MFNFLPNLWLDLRCLLETNNKPLLGQAFKAHFSMFINVFFLEKSLISGTRKDILVGSEKTNDTFSEKCGQTCWWREPTSWLSSGSMAHISFSDCAFDFLLCVMRFWVHAGKTGNDSPPAECSIGEFLLRG